MLKKMTWILKFVHFLQRNMKSTIHKISHISKTTREIFTEFYSWYLDSKHAKRWKYIFPSSGPIFSAMVTYANLIIF